MEHSKSLENILAAPYKRYLSSIIDAVIILVLISPLLYIGYKDYADIDYVNGFILMAFLVKLLVYVIVDIVIPFYTKGRTIGRLLLKLRIRNQDGSVVSVYNLVKRASIFVFISFLSDILFVSFIAYIIWSVVFVLSILFIYSDPLRQTVHDKVAKTIVVDKARNVFEIAVSLHNKGHKSIIMVVGSDRVAEFEGLLNKYNGVEAKHGYYGFDNIEVISAGERDPDAEGVRWMSESKMRDLNAIDIEGAMKQIEGTARSMGITVVD